MDLHQVIFRYTIGGEIEELGLPELEGDRPRNFRALELQSASPDANVIAGAFVFEESGLTPFVWTEESGFHVLPKDDYRVGRATGVTSDGTIVIGTLSKLGHPQGEIAGAVFITRASAGSTRSAVKLPGSGSMT